MPLRSANSRAAAVAISLIVGYAIAAYASLEFMRGPDNKAAIYLSNAFLLSGLLLLRGPWRIVCLIGCMAACASVVAWRGANPVYAAGTGVIAGIACLTGAWLGRRVLPQPSLKNIRQAIMILAFVIVPAAFVSGMLSATWIHIRMGAPIFPGAIRWFMASLVGTSMILPTLLTLVTRSTAPQAKRSPLEMATIGLMVATILVVPFTGYYLLALVFAFPAANLIAMRLGPKPTVLTLTLINLTAFSFPFLWPNSMLHKVAPQYGTIIVVGLQIYAMVVFYNGLLTSLAIEQQGRTKRQLERRTAMARAARAEALQASRAKTDFLATMSHEVRTPLNSILGFSDLLTRRNDLADEVRHQLALIHRSGESLLTIVDDLLDFSKVEAGKLALDPRPASLLAVAEASLASVAPAAAAKGLEVALTTEGPDESLNARHLLDDQRLGQVLLNFLNNAVKFTDTGRIEVRLRVHPVGSGLDAARIEVADTGVGIAPAVLPRLFQRFTQADSSISRSYGGTGLGLSISKGLAELMGGKVGAESREGQGSTFWIEATLPRAAAAEAGEGEATAASDAGTMAAHILLVDDNAANRELGVSILTVLGCTVDTACDGREAIEAAQTRAYDLILMDVHMPGVDGLAATRAIRALAGPTGQVPIIAMTADVLPEQVERCHAAGMNDHLTKPVNVERLYECLAAWLAAPEPGADTEAAA